MKMDKGGVLKVLFTCSEFHLSILWVMLKFSIDFSLELFRILEYTRIQCTSLGVSFDRKSYSLLLDKRY